jgi:hypothetical protein
MPRGRPRKNADDMLLKSAELIGWALGGIEREIVETRNRLGALTAQAAALRKRVGDRVAVAAAEVAPGKRRRRGMSEMMKKRWAERRKAKQK